MPTNKDIRKKASETVLRSGVWLKLVIGVCICIAAVMTSILVFELLIEISMSFQGIYSDIFDILALVFGVGALHFFAVPMICGFFGMAYKLYSGNRSVGLDAVFSPFASRKKYARALRVGNYMIYRVFACIICVSFYISAITYLSKGLMLDELPFVGSSIIIFAWLSAIALFVVMPFSLTDGFFAGYLICRGYGARKAYAISKKMVRGNRSSQFKFVLGFSGVIVISLALIFAPFIVYTIPLILFAYFIYSERMCEYLAKKEEERLARIKELQNMQAMREAQAAQAAALSQINQEK